MEDNFFRILNEEPSKGFSKRLKSRLDSIPMKAARSRSLGNLAWLPAIGILICISVMLFTVPSVRAAVSNFIVKVAGQAFEVNSEYPKSGEPVTTLEPMELSPDEAMKLFMVKLPAEIADPAYRLKNEPASIYLDRPNFPDMLQLKYEPSDGTADLIILTVIREKNELVHVVGSSHIEEVSIGNGKTGALVNAGWFADTKIWKDQNLYTLSWQEGELNFGLMGKDPKNLIAFASQISGTGLPQE